MFRLIRRYSFFDEQSMETLNWILKEDMPKIANAVFEELRGLERAKFEAEINEDPEDLSRILQRALNRSSRAIPFRIKNVILEALRKRKLKMMTKGKSNLEKSLATLKTMFHLNDPEIELCLFLLIISQWDKAENYFSTCLDCDKFRV